MNRMKNEFHSSAFSWVVLFFSIHNEFFILFEAYIQLPSSKVRWRRMKRTRKIVILKWGTTENKEKRRWKRRERDEKTLFFSFIIIEYSFHINASFGTHTHTTEYNKFHPFFCYRACYLQNIRKTLNFQALDTYPCVNYLKQVPAKVYRSRHIFSGGRKGTKRSLRNC